MSGDQGASADDHSLEDAYALKTPEDSVELYRGWAENYDQAFAAAMGYVYDHHIARIYLEEQAGTPGEVLDVGAGTGLVAAQMEAQMPGVTMDAVDISQEMLDVAGAKGLYRARIQADLTQVLPIQDAAYDGLVSAGVFTHGHVGPGCLPELLRVAKPGAACVFGINGEVFDSMRFGSAFADLVGDGAITPVRFQRVNCYEGVSHDHADTTILAALFRKC